MSSIVAKMTNVSPMFYRILSKFPSNISMCFAYGSGVKQQLGYGKKKPMIDLIFCVENPFRWHATNLSENPMHYSAIMKAAGSNFIAQYQEDYGARVYFNTLVEVPEENIMIKYGVISTLHLTEDLLDWRDLYLAGRLQKPVEVIKPPKNVNVEKALDLNLKSAVHAALLLLPEVFTEYEFYYTIASLSYMGDFRMTFGENKDKIQNIVRPQLEGFTDLYSPILMHFNDYLRRSQKSNKEVIICEQDCSPTAILHHLNSLPKWPIRYICRDWNRGRYKQDTEDILRAVAHSSNYRDVVQRSLNGIVFQSSAKQSLKNIPTSGLMKSIKYSWAKIQKMLKS